MLIVASLAVVAGGCSCKDDYVVEVVAEREADHVDIRESLGGACGVEPADTSGELGLAILALGAFGVLVWFAWTAVNEVFAAARRATRRRRADFGSPLATRSSRRLDQAVSNNASWCRAVCATHGVGVRFDDNFQFTAIAAPQLYPDAITLRPGVDAKRIAEAIADRPGASVKDSYADLDLSEFGFTVLFAAQWFEFVPKAIDATQVTRHEYDQWVAGWRAENALACPLLPTLLDATDRERDRDAPGADGATGFGVATALVIASGGAGGAAGHLASGVIGITNAWGSDCSGAFTEIWPDTSCVAYDSVIPAGATPLGPLRIWVRTPPDRDVDPSPIDEA